MSPWWPLVEDLKRESSCWERVKNLHGLLTLRVCGFRKHKLPTWCICGIGEGATLCMEQFLDCPACRPGPCHKVCLLACRVGASEPLLRSFCQSSLNTFPFHSSLSPVGNYTLQKVYTEGACFGYHVAGWEGAMAGGWFSGVTGHGLWEWRMKSLISSQNSASLAPWSLWIVFKSMVKVERAA